MGEAVDPNHTWMTSVSVQLDIVGDRTATVTAQTIGDEQVTILGQKQLKDGSGVMFVDVPQGIGSSFGLVYDDGTPQKRYQRIDLTGVSAQVVDVNFTAAAASTRSAATRAATNTALYGSSIMADCGYLNFGSWGWSDVQKALIEAQNSKDNYTTLIDYEIMAKGSLISGGEYTSNEDILLSFLYGHTGTLAARTLGYYYHSAGDYSDIVFQDIAEVLTKDYYNGKAKVQYQLDGNPAWYDANFDYKDTPADPSAAASATRQGDDAYNTLNVYNYYLDRITAIRGLTFPLAIPRGKDFGFYLRVNTPLGSEQKSILQGLGVPDSKLSDYNANYSNASMNTGTNNYRSAMAILTSTTWC